MPRSPRRRSLGGLPLARALGAAATLGALAPHALGAQQGAAPAAQHGAQRRDSTAVASAQGAPRVTPAAPDAPQAADATATAGSRHSVKRGDTLWDISASYLGTPWRWPEIDRANKDVIRDPHWIYPGQRLRLPDGREITVGEDAPEQGPESGPEATERDDEPTTVFARKNSYDIAHAGTVPAATSRNRALDRVALASAAEWYAAPFVVTGGPKGRGQVLGNATPSGERGNDRFAQPMGRIVIAPPKGVAIARGATLLVFRDGEAVGRGHVIFPTAIATIEETARKGVVVAQLTRMFGVVEAGQGVTVVEEPPAGLVGAEPRSIADLPPLDTRVTWVERGQELPTVQTRVILGTKSRDDVQVGDVFTLVRPRRPVDGRSLGETPIADVRVVRVTSQGATAVVVRQDAPGIEPGLMARRHRP